LEITITERLESIAALCTDKDEYKAWIGFMISHLTILEHLDVKDTMQIALMEKLYTDTININDVKNSIIYRTLALTCQYTRYEHSYYNLNVLQLKYTVRNLIVFLRNILEANKE